MRSVIKLYNVFESVIRIFTFFKGTGNNVSWLSKRSLGQILRYIMAIFAVSTIVTYTYLLITKTAAIGHVSFNNVEFFNYFSLKISKVQNWPVHAGLLSVLITAFTFVKFLFITCFFYLLCFVFRSKNKFSQVLMTIFYSSTPYLLITLLWPINFIASVYAYIVFFLISRKLLKIKTYKIIILTILSYILAKIALILTNLLM